MQALKRIPQGTVTGIIPLDAAKAFPSHLFSTKEEIRFAYADQKNNEHIELQVKVAPNGAKTAPHPQLICFIRGDYHPEPFYNYGGGSDPFKWTTWMEFHLDAENINLFITALFRAKVLLEAKA